jgi:hypothetical protein
VPVVVIGTLAALRAGRRFRLRRAGATGAWAYVLDALALAGRPPARHLTAPDIGRVLANPAAVQLADLVDRAAFAPDPARSTVDPWRLAVAVRSRLRRTVPWYRRLWWPVHPKTLRRR